MAAYQPAIVNLNANHGLPAQKRNRFTALSILIPRARPLQPEMSYNRQLSPGGRRIANPARASDSLADQARYERHNSYTSPRTSVSGAPGVIPISTQTFVNYPPASSTTTTRPETRVDPYSSRPTDSYTGRPRKSSLVDTQRGAPASATALPSRNRPTVIQADVGRPTSPQKSSARDDKYYVTPAASSKEPRKVEHKKIYSVANDGTSNLVADVDMGGSRHHRRRDSEGGEQRGGYRGPSLDKDNDRGRRNYHQNGPTYKPKEKSIEDEDAYSYTDAAGMFNETEPRWREKEVRPRRGSVDRGGASRERPVSTLDPNIDPRRSQTKDIGPPPSTRGWAKINDGLGRAASTRERNRDIPQSPNRARVPQSPNRARAPTSPSRGRYADVGAYVDSKDPYYVAPRTISEDRRNTLHPDRAAYDQHEYDERREPRHHNRRTSVTKQDRPIQLQRPDHSVERRGFGIRGDSQDRYGRGSDESFERQQKYRDSAYEPHRRDTAPELNFHEEQRLEKEKQERIRAAERLRNDDRDKPMERDRRYEDDRVYNRDHEQDREPRRDRDTHYDMDRERERERERMMQPPDHERHHHRHESSRDYNAKDSNSKSVNEPTSQPGIASAATGGLAGAAAAFGIGKMMSRGDDRDKERDREAERRPERPREQDRDRLSPQPAPYRPQETHSDEGVRYQSERERDRGLDKPRERGLGFAFEGAAEPPRSAPPVRDSVQPRERPIEREMERQHEDKASTQLPHQGALDPEEDYRRRMEQVQRELGRGPDDRTSDPDPDRERRRREREQRQRERGVYANGDPSVVGSNATHDTASSSRMPGAYEVDSIVDSTASSRPGLARKPSILDRPLTDEPMAHIIDNSESQYRENRVRIVDPPTEEEERKPRGILKKPTEKFPEHPSAMREGVAPLKDATKSGIPPGARWTKIDRRLVNPEALEEAQERFEERLDCVIVLRVLTKEDIQKLADRTKAIRGKRHRSYSSTLRTEDDPSSTDDGDDWHDESDQDDKGARTYRKDSRPRPSNRGRAWTFDSSQGRLFNLLRNTLMELSHPTDERYEEEREERKAARRRDRDHDRKDRDEFDDDSENEFKPRAPRMLEAPAPSSVAGTTTTGVSAGDQADFARERRGERDRDREHQYASGSRRDDGY